MGLACGFWSAPFLYGGIVWITVSIWVGIFVSCNYDVLDNTQHIVRSMIWFYCLTLCRFFSVHTLFIYFEIDWRGYTLKKPSIQMDNRRKSQLLSDPLIQIVRDFSCCCLHIKSVSEYFLKINSIHTFCRKLAFEMDDKYGVFLY